jgi:hypothetical protein
MDRRRRHRRDAEDRCGRVDRRADLSIEEETPETPPPPSERLRVFISHGKNMDIVGHRSRRCSTCLISPARWQRPRRRPRFPVPEKVFDAMRRCGAGIIVVSAEGRASRFRPGANALAAKAASYERTVTTRYPLELGLAVCVPRKKERRRQRPIDVGLHESRATPSEPVRRFTRLEKTQPSSGRKRSM